MVRHLEKSNIRKLFYLRTSHFKAKSLFSMKIKLNDSVSSDILESHTKVRYTIEHGERSHVQGASLLPETGETKNFCSPNISPYAVLGTYPLHLSQETRTFTGPRCQMVHFHGTFDPVLCEIIVSSLGSC